MIDKIRVHCIYLRDWDIHAYIIYSACGRYNETFYDDPSAAIQYASKEYQARVEHAKCVEWLSRW